MRKAILALALMAFVAGSAGAAPQDASPTAGVPNYTDGTFPILATVDLSVNVYCVGVGYDGTNFWVSAGDQGTGTCEFYIFDEYGTQIDNVPQGGGATSWGHRDMCWNGSYMFGSFSTMVDGFGPDYMFAGYFIGALNPNRALAYDGTYFYTCGFGEQLTQMMWDGNWGSAASSAYLGAWDGAYGLAYDGTANVLYMSTADYTGNIHEIDPATGFLMATHTSLPEYDIAGGCTMACTAQFGDVLVVLQQSDPDVLTFYDLGYGPSATEVDSWGAIKAMYR